MPLRLISSDLRRTVDAAETIRTALGLSPLTLDPLLRQRDMGQWMSKSPEEIEHIFPGALAAWEQGILARSAGRRD